MRGTLPLFLVAAVAAACSSCGDSDPGPNPGAISVGGTYQTAVTLVSNVHSAEFQTLANRSGVLVPDYINPTYVNVTLRVSVKSAKNPIVISDGFNLRNLTTPG